MLRRANLASTTFLDTEASWSLYERVYRLLKVVVRISLDSPPQSFDPTLGSNPKYYGHKIKILTLTKI